MTSRRRPCTTLFPYTTLFRSQHRVARRLAECRLQVIREPASRGEQALAELRWRCPGSRISRSPWAAGPPQCEAESDEDRKSTRLNSSHTVISYAVFCLKKKNE